jgi:putative copper export protein
MSAESLSLVYLTLAKWTTCLGLFGLVGVCTLRLAVMPRAARREGLFHISSELTGRLGTIAAGAAVLVGIGAVARLYAQTYSVFGLDEPVTLDLIRVIAVESRWGQRWVPQAGAAGLALLAGSWLAARPASRLAWWAMSACVAALVVTLPLTGHLIGVGGRVGQFLHAAHLLAAALWLGTLAGVLAAWRAWDPSDRPDGLSADRWLAALVHVFSPLAIVAVTCVVVTGLVAAFHLVREVDQLWTSTYGRVLLAKGLLVGGTGAVGLYNWRRVRPRLGAETESARLKRSGGLELLLAVGALLMTAVLVHLPLPGE